MVQRKKKESKDPQLFEYEKKRPLWIRGRTKHQQKEKINPLTQEKRPSFLPLFEGGLTLKKGKKKNEGRGC